ncbi:hypothetical protein MKZ38_001113 [Zalerion maritima]|uniref:Uncharacterized protein n=1 Tax=Zalerion maritima TaxID=339359 RepID=A0AAD5RSA8_9PEZI|nr:hypothetical protein MKZ38_001113 [Zalerion maritima]
MRQYLGNIKTCVMGAFEMAGSCSNRQLLGEMLISDRRAAFYITAGLIKNLGPLLKCHRYSSRNPPLYYPDYPSLKGLSKLAIKLCSLLESQPCFLIGRHFRKFIQISESKIIGHLLETGVVKRAVFETLAVQYTQSATCENEGVLPSKTVAWLNSQNEEWGEMFKEEYILELYLDAVTQEGEEEPYVMEGLIKGDENDSSKEGVERKGHHNEEISEEESTGGNSNGKAKADVEGNERDEDGGNETPFSACGSREEEEAVLEDSVIDFRVPIKVRSQELPALPGNVGLWIPSGWVILQCGILVTPDGATIWPAIGPAKERCEGCFPFPCTAAGTYGSPTDELTVDDALADAAGQLGVGSEAV